MEIDGSYGEGGGQILRMAVAMSALTGKPVRVYNIRAKRSNPGLRMQHITAIKAVGELCNARIKGLQVGSKSIEFYPGKIKGGEYFFGVGTAGSITLVLQACLLPAIMGENETYLKIKGGTDVKWAPPWDYFENVFLKILENMNCHVDAYLNERGYYPEGGGEVEIYIEPCDLKRLTFNKDIRRVRGIVNISNLPYQIAERIKKSAVNVFTENKIKADISIEETSSIGKGVGIVVWSEPKILGSDCIGEKGKMAEEVGREAAENLLAEIKSNADIDERAVDQILPYISITGGNFKCRMLSNHAKTEMWLIKKFMDIDFKIKKNEIYEIEVSK